MKIIKIFNQIGKQTRKHAENTDAIIFIKDGDKYKEYLVTKAVYENGLLMGYEAVAVDKSMEEKLQWVKF
jgi:hypothetical protein